MADFYDWHKTLSFDADVTMVIGPRGIGKTFGLRYQCIKDFLKDGSRFVEVCRFKAELSGVSDGYFGGRCSVDSYSTVRCLNYCNLKSIMMSWP